MAQDWFDIVADYEEAISIERARTEIQRKLLEGQSRSIASIFRRRK